MAGRKKAEKPEEDAKATADAAASSDNVSTDANGSSAAPADAETEGPKADATPASVTPDAEGQAANADDNAADKPIEKPEETALPSGQPSAGLSTSQANAILDAVLGTPPKPNLRRFIVFKTIRFKGKRIPHGGRVTVTRADHDELAGLGAVSSVWDHGTPVETE
ncbi:hypothetical protein [Martelella mediterranea]|uniref:Mu-like prophage FluMu N-terminal domain-containing protein n=1 Tax=Martelella mediterranea DSM 17316 TaxID=1122214 RepID=A0A1U9Z2M7_9HYPH|nr:hypothetical protein [Martelella mediterranea]AQZ51914.1 hypothetical protein Mame_02588 [Martelella mediterranea DSM 17316]